MATNVPFNAPLGVIALAVQPTSPAVGDTFFNTASGRLETWDGTVWVSAATIRFVSLAKWGVD